MSHFATLLGLWSWRWCTGFPHTKFPPKTKCNFSKTESAVCTSMCYMDIAKTPVALELTRSIDCALWTLDMQAHSWDLQREHWWNTDSKKFELQGEGNAEKLIEKSQLSWKRKGNKRRVMQSKTSFVSKWVQIFPPNSFLFTCCYEVQSMGNTINVSPLDDGE